LRYTKPEKYAVILKAGNSVVSVLIVLFICFSLSSLAQYTYTLDKTTRFERLGINEGLSTDFALKIHQDKYGFIWIGTQRGLNLFDGYKVKSFVANLDDSNAIESDYIGAIYEENDGTMWFGTEKGISRYNRANQTFSNFFPYPKVASNFQNRIYQIVDDGENLWLANQYGFYRFNIKTEVFTYFGEDTVSPEKGIKGEGTNYLFIDKSGTLWINSWQSGKTDVLNRLNKESGTFAHFEHDPANPESYAGKWISSMIEDRQGTLWMATMGGGLIEMTDKEKGRFRQYKHDALIESTINSDNLGCVFEDSKGIIWTCSQNGFSKLNRGAGEFTNYPIPDKHKAQLLIDVRVDAIRVDIIEDMNGELWTNANNSGLLRLDPLQERMIHYLNEPDNEYSISDNNITQVIIGQSGQIWACTWYKGLCTINPYSNTFKRIQTKPNSKSSLLKNVVTNMFVDSEDNFWISTFGGGLNRTRIKHGEVLENFEHFIFDADNPNSIGSDYVFGIYEDRNNSLWFSTFNGLNKYDPKTRKITSYRNNPKDSSTISSSSVLNVCEDSQGMLWVGTEKGLNIMDIKTGKFTRILPDANDPKSIKSKYISVIYKDSRGELWIGGEQLERLNRKDSSFIHYPNIGRVWDIKEDDSTNLWIASLLGGLFHWERKSQVFKAITVKEGLPSNYILATVIDDNGDIWVGSEQGLSRIKKHSLNIKVFDDADGLVSREFVPGSRLKDKEGWLYFGTQYGITYFQPDSLRENIHIPPVYITSMYVAGKQKYFNKPLFELSSIDLKYNENDFGFDFVALDYVNPHKNQYAYTLEGYDDDWKSNGNKHSANYTNLGPGKYTFRVKGSNNDGYWNEEGASLIVIIHPPFWKTWWAYGLYIISFLMLLYLIRRNELRKIQLRQEIEIKNVNEENLAKLDREKNKFFSNISHEFRTPLTLILGPLNRVIGRIKKDEDKTDLKMVHRSALRLQTLINQLLSLSKLESGSMKLNTRPENIVQLTRMFLESFHSLAEDRGIKTEFESVAEEYTVYLDKLKFEKIVNNLLSNAFKFTERGGKIKVSLQSSVISRQSDPKALQTANRVQIKISDTGIGIRKDRLQHVFDRFYQVDEQQKKSDLGTGIGLALTKELVELHHGEINVDSETGMGTTFTLFFPTGKDHLASDEIVGPATAGDEVDDEMLQDRQIFVPDAVTRTLTTDEEGLVESDLPLLLIVEDNADMRAYIKSYLVDAYQVIEASNGKEGAEMAINYLPDLVVSDLMMPVMDGNEMTQQLKNDERSSHIPIILLTAKSSIASKLEGLETGADDFLTKPFDAEELLVRIRNLIETRRKLRELLSLHIGDEAGTKIIRETAGKAMSKLDEQFLEKIKNSVDEQMSNPDFSVESLAKEVAMSRVQLHRKLKSLTDLSPSDIIRDIRLAKAAELLKEGELNVTEVTYEIGISSLSYFSKAFKEKFGVTPSEFTSK